MGNRPRGRVPGEGPSPRSTRHRPLFGSVSCPVMADQPGLAVDANGVHERPTALGGIPGGADRVVPQPFRCRMVVACSGRGLGHSGADGDWVLREGMDWRHCMAVSAWGGSILARLLLVFPRLTCVSTDLLARLGARFSLIASCALAVVLVSGMYSSWRMLPGIS